MVPSAPGAEWLEGLLLSKQIFINPLSFRTVSPLSAVPGVPKSSVLLLQPLQEISF